MTDDNTNGAGPSADNESAGQQGVRMQILTQYVRDLSFENAVAQKGLPAGEVQPEISVQVSLDARKRPADHQYEVISKYRVQSANNADKAPLFLCELDYGGIFHVEGVPDDQMHPFLMIECPRYLFPFARRIIADLTAEGGFPPFMLEPIDFAGIYASRRPGDQTVGNA